MCLFSLGFALQAVSVSKSQLEAASESICRSRGNERRCVYWICFRHFYTIFPGPNYMSIEVSSIAVQVPHQG